MTMQAAITLLASILEAPEPIISESVGANTHPEAFAILRAAGVLVPDGDDLTMSSLTHDDGRPVTLIWDSERETYGYFDPNTGWIDAPIDGLARWRVKIPSLLARLLAECRAPGSTEITEVIPGLVWDAGKVRLPGRDKHVSVWFARRLFVSTTWRKLRQTARNQPPEIARVVVTSTTADRLADEALPQHVLIALQDALPGADTLAIVPGVLASRLAGGAPSTSGLELEVIGDGRLVRLRGKDFTFPRGDRQRRIILFLYGRYLSGEPRVSVAQMIADLGLSAHTRLRDVFKDHPAWGVLLDESSGTCGFCLNHQPRQG